MCSHVLLFKFPMCSQTSSPQHLTFIPYALPNVVLTLPNVVLLSHTLCGPKGRNSILQKQNLVFWGTSIVHFFSAPESHVQAIVPFPMHSIASLGFLFFFIDGPYGQLLGFMVMNQIVKLSNFFHNRIFSYYFQLHSFIFVHHQVLIQLLMTRNHIESISQSFRLMSKSKFSHLYCEFKPLNLPNMLIEKNSNLFLKESTPNLKFKLYDYFIKP